MVLFVFSLQLSPFFGAALASRGGETLTITFDEETQEGERQVTRPATRRIPKIDLTFSQRGYCVTRNILSCLTLTSYVATAVFSGIEAFSEDSISCPTNMTFIFDNTTVLYDNTTSLYNNGTFLTPYSFEDSAAVEFTLLMFTGVLMVMTGVVTCFEKGNT